MKVNRVSSELQPLNDRGVPQRSVLGPILFLLFINDIHQAHKEGTIKLFADDTNFSYQIKFLLLKQKVILEISYLQNCVDANKLTINYDPKKSCYNMFKPLNQPLPLNSWLTVSNQIVKSPSLRYKKSYFFNMVQLIDLVFLQGDRNDQTKHF